MRLLRRLLDSDDYILEEYVGNNIPPYAILSHTWGLDNDEVTFKDVMKSRGKDKPGYRKLKFCSEQAAKDDLHFFWVDTCCIDKTSSAELTEAINSMFKWYRGAEKCYVLLSDVSVSSPVTEITQEKWAEIFQHSRWFKRGWTLQELLAPRSVEFFSKAEDNIGDKESLQNALHVTTGLPIPALKNSTLSQFSVDERISWAERRETKREEDAAYSLLGIFDTQIPLIYGEGRDRAFARLRREIEGSLGARLQLANSQRAWTVPFGRDPDFVNRDSLDRIYQICNQPAGRVSLVGLGGIGKSQIAIEYSYRARDRSPTKWVFWVHAGTQARFEAGYRRIAEATKMDGWNDPKVNILRLVRSWLCDDSNGRWTMIVDNADDATVFYPNVSQICEVHNSEQSLEPLSDYLPHSPNGSILITSRNHSLAERLTGNCSGVIQVMPMSKNDALVLLEKKLGFAAAEEKASDLVDILEAMPLAITQAAAFIRKQGPRMSVSKYVDAVRRSDKDQARLLGKDLGDSRRDSQATNSIIATWQISFEHIRNSLPTAANLLSLMSLFDRQGIPERLLQDRYGNDQEEADFDDDVQTLLSFSLIRISADGSEFEMHRLVQLATKNWLELHNKLEKWKGTLAIVMKDNYPYGDYKNWPICQPLFPHVQAMSSNKPKETETLKAWAFVLHNAAWYLCQTGQHSKAFELSSAALQVRESILGPEHLDSLCTLNNMGIILIHLGQYSEAESALRKALNAKVRVLGQHHLRTLESMANLASTYINQARNEEAEKLGTEVLQKYTKILGEDHPDTRSSMYRLALIHFAQGRYKEAEELGIKVMQKRIKSLGEDHPKTLNNKSMLALTYSKQGRYKEAEELGIKTLQRYMKILGEEHPDTLSTMDNLAYTYSKQKRFKQAEELGIKVMQKLAKSLGEEHPYTLTSMSNLAHTYNEQKRFKEAEELGFGVLQKRMKSLGEGHPNTLTSMINLAHTYSEQNRFKEAEELIIKVVQASRETLGEEHPDTLKRKHNLACVYKDLGRHAEAVDMMRTCAEQRRRIIGPEHPDTRSSSRWLDIWKVEQTILRKQAARVQRKQVARIQRKQMARIQRKQMAQIQKKTAMGTGKRSNQSKSDG